MKILGENENNDLFVGDANQLVLRVDLPAILQACESAVEAQRGEMQYDITRGIPTDATLWSGVANQKLFRFYCIQAIRAIPGVLSVLRFDSDIFNNILQYEAEIATEFGTGIIGDSINGL